VPRLILENLRTVDGKNWSTGVDPVAIQARFLKDAAGLLTNTPTGTTTMQDADIGCAGTDEDGNPIKQTIAEKSFDLSLLIPPTDNRTGMAGYVASQLFLTGLKGESIALPGVETGQLLQSQDEEPDCATEVASQAQMAQDFHIVLKGYLNARTVTKDSLIKLGLSPDTGIATGAESGLCN
jgi:hypothetical protein